MQAELITLISVKIAWQVNALLCFVQLWCTIDPLLPRRSFTLWGSKGSMGVLWACSCVTDW